MLQLDIIRGYSFFTGTAIVGVAVRGDADTVRLVRLADARGSYGRPAATTDAAHIEYLVRAWRQWADRLGIVLDFNTDPRDVSRGF